jgi:hypothetical protein
MIMSLGGIMQVKRALVALVVSLLGLAVNAASAPESQEQAGPQVRWIGCCR